MPPPEDGSAKLSYRTSLTLERLPWRPKQEGEGSSLLGGVFGLAAFVLSFLEP